MLNTFLISASADTSLLLLLLKRSIDCPIVFRSELSRNRRTSVQNYIDDDLPTPTLSSFKSPMMTTTTFQPTPPFKPPKPTPEEIERDVEIIFRNMGLDRYTNP